VERSEWPDDDASDNGAYPPAPLPAHERAWRHPSELGQPGWTHIDPPITIGRGLLITTGAIGGLLSLAVLWAMLPSTGRGGTAAPTVVTSTANNSSGPVITARADTLVATSVDVVVPSTTLRTVPSTEPTSDEVATTVETSPETVGSQGSELEESAPVAVGIGDSLVITTARAVAGRTSITLTGADGQPHEATVLMVDSKLGLAVLSADEAGMTTSYGIGPAANSGDVVTVLGANPTTANVSVDAEGHLRLDPWAESTAEGTPVINADGLLVGICSHGSSGFELVSVASVGAMLPSNKRPPNSPWLGVHVVVGDQGALVIDWVGPDGPSAAAGLVAGDSIAAVDAVAIHSVDELKAAVSKHAPGDVITLTITHADQTSTDVAVTLGTAPNM
jgi:S1-C subfamily serine protease